MSLSLTPDHPEPSERHDVLYAILGLRDVTPHQLVEVLTPRPVILHHTQLGSEVLVHAVIELLDLIGPTRILVPGHMVQQHHRVVTRYTLLTEDVPELMHRPGTILVGLVAVQPASVLRVETA